MNIIDELEHHKHIMNKIINELEHFNDALDIYLKELIKEKEESKINLIKRRIKKY